MATNKIGIGIDAQIDTAKVEAGLKRIQSQFERAGKTKIEPVSDKAISNTDKLFQQLKRVDTELRRRAKATGQGDASFENFNFETAYPNAANRTAKLRTVYNYVGAGAPPGAGGGGRTGGGFGSMAMGAAQAGMRAAGPAGGVAAGALGTGLASGAGAGLMGLMGGMLALGVGKLVSGVMDKVEQAEGNAIAYDKLKRVLGDVGVSFVGLKAAVQGSAKNLSITFDEAGKLSTQFAKAANLKGDDYKTLPDELRSGVGLSRAFGLDPSEGVGVLGKMRGLGVTKDVQDSRRFALLIGETIGKSGAFAKADEVMSAMADYATQQTRSSLGGANVSGYAGMFSSMVGSGIPGMDPAGASGLLSKINGILAGGGGKGEASQFFTGQVGSRMGLDPFRTQVMREHGAFATNDESFKKGTPYELYMGKEGPKGSSTFLQETRAELERQFPSNSDYDKRMRAMSFANHATGGNINQAMGMLALTPDKMGELSDFAGKDLSKLSTSGLSNLIMARQGTADQRQGLAKGYLGRTGSEALKGPDRDAITNAMGNDNKLKEVLGRIALQMDQEKTSGQDIRDSKNTLDNIKTEFAENLIPLTQQIRHGIMHIAGAGKLSPMEVMADVMRLESKDRASSIKGEFAGREKSAADESLAAKKRHKDAYDDLVKNGSKMSPTELAEAQSKLARLWDESARKDEDVRLRILDLQDKKAEAIGKETEELNKSIEGLRKSNTPQVGDIPIVGGGNGLRNSEDPRRLDRGAALDTGSLDASIADAEATYKLPKGVLKAVMQQETGGDQSYLNDPSKYHYGINANGQRIAGHTGKVSTAFGPFGILESTAARPGYGVAPLQNKGMQEQIRFSAEYLAARSASKGGIEKGLAGYGEGDAYSKQVMKRMGAGTPTPGGGGGAGTLGSGTFNLTAPPVVIEFINPPKEMVMPRQGLQFKLSPPSPRIGGGN